MAKEKLTTLENLNYFLSWISRKFSAIGHKHTKNEITDLVVDSALSSSSSNPIENKAVQAAVQKLEDEKANRDELGVFYVSVTGDEETGYSADKTYEEIMTAVANNYQIIAICSNMFIPLLGIMDDILMFSFNVTESGQYGTIYFTIAPNNVVSLQVDLLTPEGIGALPDTTFIPTKVSELTNDSNFVTSSDIATHNTSDSAHNDLRLLISELSEDVSHFLNVDDTTKDQLSELIALIEENADDIADITSNKVNISDIINNLTTNVNNKPLSAAQGVVIKALIDALQTALNTDVGNLATHTGNTTAHITATERTNWNDAVSKEHTHSNKSVLDNTTASYTTAEQTKLSGIATGATNTIDWFGNGISIPSNSDLDTYTTPGKYYCGSGDVCKTLVNSPVASDNFTLFVLKRTTGASITQLIITLGSQIYIRGCNSSGDLRTWQRKVNESEINEVIAVIGELTGLTTTEKTSVVAAINELKTLVATAQETANGKAPSSHNHDASNITSGTISTSRLPKATGDTAGITIVYPAASCTTFSSDSGTVTPAAVQKGAKQFAITRPSSSTNKAIVRYSNTTGDVQDSKIIIEDVTNSKDSSKKAQVISIPAEGGKKMVYGYCTDQVDGTSFIGGVFPNDATEYPYAQGLAIGGTSGNLLWKGSKVATADDLATKQATITGGATTITSSNLTASRALVSNASGKVAASAITSTELGYLDGVTSNIQTQLDDKQPIIWGAASSILDTVLEPNRVLLSNEEGYVWTSMVTETELEHLAGVTDNIQEQLDFHNHSGKSIAPASLEMTPSTSASHGGYIDFHYNGSTDDYTHRIIDKQESTGNYISSVLEILGAGVKVPDPSLLSLARARNITCQTAPLTAGSSSLATGRIYLQYE